MQPEQVNSIISAIRDLNNSLAIKDIISIIAILLSPIIAVSVTLYWQSRNAAINRKQRVFEALMSMRCSIITEEQVRLFNMIDTVFYKERGIRKLYQELFEMFNDKKLDNPLGDEAREKKYRELLTEMAKVLKYGRRITNLDVDRVYLSSGLGTIRTRREQIENELLRVLKGCENLQIPTKIEKEVIEQDKSHQ